CFYHLNSIAQSKPRAKYVCTRKYNKTTVGIRLVKVAITNELTMNDDEYN
ncbi:MAG: hypothetical protein ACI8RD_001204, partial [Bacillariaceae sp.]